MGEMSKAAGSADAEMSVIRDSMDYKINALKETWKGVLIELADRGVLKGFIDGLTGISEGLASILTNSKALVPVIGSLVGAFATYKTKDSGRDKTPSLKNGGCHCTANNFRCRSIFQAA